MQLLAMPPGQGHLRSTVSSANALAFIAVSHRWKAVGALCAPRGVRVCDSCGSGKGCSEQSLSFSPQGPAGEFTT